MNYEVKFDSLNGMYYALQSQSGSWMEQLADMESKWKALVDTDNMWGGAADSVKLYIETVHLSLLSMMRGLIEMHANNCLLYKDDYQSNIDTDLHAVLLSDALYDCQRELEDTKKRAVSVDDGLAYTLGGIKDIFTIPYARVDDAADAHQAAIDYMAELDEDIINLENRHADNDFLHTDELIQSLRAMMMEQKGKSRSYRTDFTMESLAGSAAMKALYESYVSVAEEYEGKASAIDSAIENEEDRIAILQKEEEERAERAEKAKVFKWVVTGAAVVGSIAVIVGTGGAATPLVVAGVSAASAAVTTGASAMADQYVTHGYDHDQYDWGGVMKDTVLAAGVGFVTGYAGAAIGGAITEGLGATKIGAELLHSGSRAVRMGSAAVIGSASETVSGMATRATATVLTGGTLSDAGKNALDGKEIAKDALIGGVSNSIDHEVSLKNAQTMADQRAAEYNEAYDPVGAGQEAGIKNLKRTANNGADFSETNSILRTKKNKAVEITITPTGNKYQDCKAAEKALREQGVDVDFKKLSKGKDGYTWYTMDDYDATTNKVTMQYVKKEDLDEIGPYASGQQQYHSANGEGYGKENKDWNHGKDIGQAISTGAGGASDMREIRTGAGPARRQFPKIPKVFEDLHYGDPAPAGA